MIKKTCQYSIIVIALLVAFSLTGYVAPPAASGKPINLILSSANPEKHPVAIIFKAWAKDIETLSNGKIKVIPHWAGALGAAKDQYDMVIDGISDLSEFPVGWSPGRFPLSEITGLPIRGDSSEQICKSINEVVKKGYLNKEHSEVHLLIIGATSPQKFWSRKKISSISDLKGMKIRALTKPEVALVKALGGVPTPMPITEMYLALDRGVMDAGFFDYGSSMAFKLYEVAPYVMELNVYSTPVAMIMNKAWYEKLSPDLKTVIDKSTEPRAAIAGRTLDKFETMGKGVGVKHGLQVIEVSAADRARLNELAQPIITKWADSLEVKGYPAKAAVKTYMDALQKYKPSK